MTTARDLLKDWLANASDVHTQHEYLVRLPLHDAARVHALAEMYPGRTETQILTNLLSVALAEIEQAFPYVQGNREISRDEFDDPLYEDIGPTPRFKRLTSKYAKLMLENSAEQQALVRAASGETG